MKEPTPPSPTPPPPPNHGRPSAWPLLLLPLFLLSGRESARAEFLDGFTYSVDADRSITITGYDCNFETVDIPARFAGLPVTRIGPLAFTDCTGLTRVTIPRGVTLIGERAFENRGGLTHVTIPESVTHIEDSAFAGSGLTNLTLTGSAIRLGNRAFANCHRFATLDLAEGVLEIGSQAFSGCGTLTSVRIPRSVGRIGAGAFASCPSLKSIQVEASNASYLGRNGVLFDKTRTTLLQWPAALEGYTIPEGTTAIGDQAFEGCPKLTDIAIPAGVTHVGAGAFSSCIALTHVAIPGTVTRIGVGAFESCYNLASITVDSLNPSYRTDDGVLLDTFATTVVKCPPRRVGHYTIPQGTTVIAERAFRSCSGLTSIAIPAGVTRIEEEAFVATGLTSVSIPPGVTHLGARAFVGTGLTEVTIPGSLSRIEESAFAYCTDLTTVTLSSGVTHIGDHAFQDCSRLHFVAMPSTVIAIGNWAFSGCQALKTQALPERLASIGNAAFANTRMSSVTLPGSVTNLGAFSFASTPISSLTIPAGVNRIGEGAFASCPNLTAITVDALNSDYRGVDGILLDKSGTTVVTCPAGVRNYTIPDGVHRIADRAFQGCTLLTNLAMPRGVRSIGNAAFMFCSALREVALPSGVTTIGDEAFQSCRSLESVTVPEGVTRIAEGTFQSSGLKRISIPASVSEVGKQAFHSCHALTNVVFAKGISRIGALAFSGCGLQGGVEIPDSVTRIGTSAFSVCRNLTALYFSGKAPIAGPFEFHDFGLPTARVTLFYLPGASGWQPTLAGAPTAFWSRPNPVILPSAPEPGLRADRFGFSISWARSATVLVESSDSPTSSDWHPVSTHTIRYSPCGTHDFNGWASFTDPEASLHPARFYRLRGEPNSVGAGTNPTIALDDVLGTYRRHPVANGFHTGTITAKSAQTGNDRLLYWLNAAGVGWDLCPQLAEGLLATSGTPYPELPNHDRFILNIKAGKVIGFYFLGEHYERDVAQPGLAE